jgi:prevent-host-death family protein
MQTLNLDKNILPVSDFRANTAMFLKKIKKDKQPIFLTQHGRGAAVILAINEYAKLKAASENKTEQNNNDLLELAGTWEDDRDVEQIIEDIYSSRTTSISGTML